MINTPAMRHNQDQSWTFCTCFQCFPSRKYAVQSRAKIVIHGIVDYVEYDLLNICMDDLLHECSNFVRTNIGSISIRSKASTSNYIHVKRWNVTLNNHPCHDSNGQAGARLWNGVSHPCLSFNGLSWDMSVNNILYAVYLENYAEVFECRRFGLSTFRFVDVSVCRRLGLSTFWFVDVSVCRRFGLSTFWFVDVSVCRRFSLSTFWLSTFRFVNVLTSNPDGEHKLIQAECVPCP